MPALRAVLTAFLLALTIGACGDDAGSGGSVDEILAETFANAEAVRSGVLDVGVRIDAEGAKDLEGPVRIQLKGPFKSDGEGKLPAFDLKASLNGAGQNLTAGAISTGGKGFVSLMGKDYEVPAAIWGELSKGAKDATPGKLSTLGIDPRGWLKDAKTAGKADVGGTETDRITGSVDIVKLLDDLDQALAQAGKVGGAQAAPLPSRLTDRQRKEVGEAIKSAQVEIFSGSEDRLLRRLLVTLELVATESSKEDFKTAKVVFDLKLTGLNEDQTITAPKNPAPLGELLSSFGLGGEGGTFQMDGPGAEDPPDAYTDCLAKAGSNSAKASECAALLTAP